MKYTHNVKSKRHCTMVARPERRQEWRYGVICRQQGDVGVLRRVLAWNDAADQNSAHLRMLVLKAQQQKQPV